MLRYSLKSSRLPDKEAKITLANGDSTFLFTCADKTYTTTAIDVICTTTTTGAIAGPYKISKVEATTATSVSSYTYTAVKDVAFYNGETVTVKTTQSKTTQEGNANSTDKNTFTVELENDAKYVRMFSDAEGTKQIACTVATKVATCKPTTKEMETGKEYKIYSSSACAKATERGVTVQFSGSSFVAFSRFMIVAALFLL